MTPDGLSRALLDKVARAKELVKLFDAQTPTPDWLLEDLGFAWREAQGEAAEAYDHWRHTPGVEGYACYRASQDRADAAQDVLQVAVALAGSEIVQPRR
jgi:hypothetical protein